MLEAVLTGIGSLVVGGGLGFTLRNYINTYTLKKAKQEAADLIAEANDAVEIKALEEKERTQEIELEMWSKVEPDMLKVEARIEELQELIDEKKQKHDAALAEERKKLQIHENETQQQEKAVQAQEIALQKIRAAQKQLNDEFTKRLSQKLNTSPQETKQQIAETLEQETYQRLQKWAEEYEEETKEHAETRAKRILDVALDRFARPYCAERGIGAVNFPDANARRLLCDAKGENIKTLQEVGGCDIIVEPEMEMVGVAGFDPVRRELTRRVIERVLKEKKNLTPDFIRKVAENQKKELFRQIKADGDAIAKELRQQDLHPEIKQMMGSLRYRYSFTQNQYFHCGEVGWLAGLLAAELKMNVKTARRSGLLHDIGKSMDHAIDGGHAVIGADFIQARNESPEVVHAVRAHHYDEQPSTDHAFLVIAADAISGARPGARRSTIESYNQKVSELQDIARSFDGVTDCYVLNGGRECRVMVNSRKVDDSQTLALGRKIATKIEEECNYPGQIKVVIVRETVVSESTKGHN
ncbi:MAG TPA: Rnase Y domain-containing protein [Pseudobdellovibrionaceae bacterium]|jgi:ribonuclease Y